jgi:hypothetical protein
MQHLHHPHEFIPLIPQFLPIIPDDGDLVFLALHRGRMVMITAVQTGPGTSLIAVWDEISADIRTVQADRVFLFAYLPAQATSRLHDLARHAGPVLQEILRIQPGHWWSIACSAPGKCCPPEGTLPTTSTPHNGTDASTPPASTTLAAPDALPTFLRPGPAVAISQVRQALTALRTPPATTPPAHASDPEPVEVITAAHAATAHGHLPSTGEQAATLLNALNDPGAWVHTVAWSDNAAWQLWTSLIHWTPPEMVPPVATLIATTAYQRGDTLHARIAAAYALSVDPGHSIALLVMQFLEWRVSPGSLTRAIDHALTAMDDQT